MGDNFYCSPFLVGVNMNCKYDYYKEEEKYCPYLYCKIDDKRCIYSKRCLKVDKFIPMDGDVWKECPKYNMQMQKEIPSGANFVQTYRIDKKGNLILYVVMNNKVEKINTNLKELNQNYVYVQDGLDGYEVSLFPFQKKSITYTNNKDIITLEYKNNNIENDTIVNDIKVEKATKKKSYNKKKVGLSDEEEKEYSSR
jgi:hypothetical protein